MVAGPSECNIGSGHVLLRLGQGSWKTTCVTFYCLKQATGPDRIQEEGIKGGATRSCSLVFTDVRDYSGLPIFLFPNRSVQSDYPACSFIMAVVPEKRDPESALLSSMWGHSEKSAVCNPEEGSHQDLTMVAA